MSAVPAGEPLPDIMPVAALVAAARTGNLVAKETLFRRYAPMANRLALRLLGRDSDVDDLVQETFLQGFASLRSLTRPEVFGSWLASIMVRIAHKVLRRRRLLVKLGLRRHEPIDVDALLAPGTPQEDALEAQAVYGAIEDLPAKLRIPFLLRRAEEMELADIAEMTGTSLATTKRRIAEVDERLRAASPWRRRP